MDSGGKYTCAARLSTAPAAAKREWMAGAFSEKKWYAILALPSMDMRTAALRVTTSEHSSRATSPPSSPDASSRSSAPPSASAGSVPACAPTDDASTSSGVSHTATRAPVTGSGRWRTSRSTHTPRWAHHPHSSSSTHSASVACTMHLSRSTPHAPYFAIGPQSASGAYASLTSSASTRRPARPVPPRSRANPCMSVSTASSEYTSSL